MITLREVDHTNFDACTALRRESRRFVGSAESVLACAYLYRDDSRAYAICRDETVVGLVILRDFPTEARPYAFTELFIADDFQAQGCGKQSVGAILEKFRAERKSSLVRIQVHESNAVAIGIYRHFGFRETKRADWNADFLVMELSL